MFLEKIQNGYSIKNLSLGELKNLVAEIRAFLIEKVCENGGHLSSNLGVIEVSVILHYLFDFKKDKIIFDVSHQCYTHKILTGRIEGFNKLRKKGGVSGFTAPSESEYDIFKQGHAGSSISLGLGLKTGLDMLSRSQRVFAFIGDASIANGMAFEAINHLGHLKKNLIIVLNDNQMSISKTIGAFSGYLSRFLSGKTYNDLKKDIEILVRDIPFIGDSLSEGLQDIRRILKKHFMPNIFEEMGLHYIGPVDGHNLTELYKIFSNLGHLGEKPIIVHVITQKGKGLKEAEEDPVFYHGLPGRNKKKEITFTQIFGSQMLEMVKKDPKIKVITAAMTDGTGLNEVAKEFPESYFDVGIAESHAVGFAAGLAKAGFKPFIAIYSTFLQRSFDQIFQEVCLQEDIAPVFIMDRSGLVGEDGATHHGCFDIAYTKIFPRSILLSPKDGLELIKMMEWARDINAPVFIRFPKGSFYDFNSCEPIVLGKAEILREDASSHFVVFSYGSLAGEIKQLNHYFSYSFTHINLRFAKPLDKDLILRFASQKLPLIVLEEHSKIGGVGESIAALLLENGFSNPLLLLGLEDRFYCHAQREELLEEAGLTAPQIAKRIENFLNTIQK